MLCKEEGPRIHGFCLLFQLSMDPYLPLILVWASKRIDLLDWEWEQGRTLNKGYPSVQVSTGGGGQDPSPCIPVLLVFLSHQSIL